MRETETETEECSWETLSLWPGCEKAVQPSVVLTDFLGCNGLGCLPLYKRPKALPILALLVTLMTGGLLLTHISSWSFLGPSSAVRGSGQGGPVDLRWVRVMSFCCKVGEGGVEGVRGQVSVLE